MMAKCTSRAKAVVVKLATIPVFIILSITLISWETTTPCAALSIDDWWSPYIGTRDIPSEFNCSENMFEIGSTNTVKNRVVMLENAFVLLKIENEYVSIESPLMHHNLDKNEITATGPVTLKTYNKESQVPILVQKLTTKSTMNIGGILLFVKN
jgi:hypothetical protein